MPTQETLYHAVYARIAATTRQASSVARWTPAAKEPVVTRSALPCRWSLVSLGLHALHCWLHEHLPQPPTWRRTHLTDPSWHHHWLARQGQRLLFGTVRP